MTSYELYPAAENDLEDIWQYSVARWSVKQALQYLDGLDGTFPASSRFPTYEPET